MDPHRWRVHLFSLIMMFRLTRFPSPASATWLGVAILAGVIFAPCVTATESDEKAAVQKPVSFYKDIRPIFQAQCYGCHQPSKAKGDYIMTDFSALLKGGEEGAAVVGGKPDASQLLKEITPDSTGKAAMPQKADALHETQIALINRWIAEGAKDDTPASARRQYDMENLPQYAKAPLITSVDYSKDGRWIAVAGYHEVLLHKADGSGIEARFVGLSERIQKIRFSPDSRSLAVAGGNPGRMGEIQIWDIEAKKLEQSISVTFDTLYGLSWSPDGTRIAFGGADNSLRAIEVKSGKQVLFNGSANDWVLDTVWSVDGSHLVSTSRDMSAKLTEVATERFVDNITSITPGALRGGIHAVARHPSKDEILIGGADGLPQVYRIHRQTKRVIGDNANLVRKFPAMEGRIFSVDYSPDGNLIAAASSYRGKGAVNIYSAKFDSALTEELKKIHEKRVSDQSADEKAKVEASLVDGVKILHSIPLASAGYYALRFSPDGKTLVAGAGDGLLRLIDVASGAVVKEFSSVPLADAGQGLAVDNSDAIERATAEKPLAVEMLAPERQIASLEVMPGEIHFQKPSDYAQLLVTARMKDGTRADVTRMVKIEHEGVSVDVSMHRIIRPMGDGSGKLHVSLAGLKREVPVRSSGFTQPLQPDYITDINPVLSKLGCNMGTCHGGQAGKNGFQLSLRGYDMDYDVAALADELWSRRSNVAAPARSLMLLKASGAVPHEGGQLTVPGELYYEMIKAWIAGGSEINADASRVTRIEVFPHNPVVESIGEKQQMRVMATYADGRSRDVTAEAFIESGNMEVAETDKHGLVTTLRRGEAPMLARYEGAYAATTVTVMGDRTGFAWQEPEKWSRIDELVSAKWKRMKIQPSGLASDSEFLRRVHLDLTGLPPSPNVVRAFLEDKTESRVKREQMIDRLIASDAFVEQWSNKWADMLQVNSKFLGDEGAQLFRDWIRQQVAANTPYDEFVYSILTAGGSNKENPPASYFKILRTPEDTMENTTHLFLATRFNCNKCHDHPFEKWTQGQYYETAAFFAQVGFSRDPASGDRNVGGSAVEGAKPLYEIVADTGKGEMIHQRTNKETAPAFPYPVKFEEHPEDSRREKLAEWITSPDNPYFAMSYTNRIWGYLTGTGIIEPLDDIRAGNPPSNPELLSYLTDEFIKSGFNVRHLMKMITMSRTYQLSIATNEWNEDDDINYSHAKARRLPAEALFDAIHAVTGATTKIPGAKPGARAAAIADVQNKIPDGFLGNFGKPTRESACECERSNDVQLGPVMALISGPTVGDAISAPDNALAKLAEDNKDDRQLIKELFIRILNRPATEAEVNETLETLQVIDAENKKLMQQWASYELKAAPAIVKAEQQRAERVHLAEQAIVDHKKAVEPENTRKAREREENIKKAEAQVAKVMEAEKTKLDQWASYLDLSTEWLPLDLEVVKASGVQKLEKQADGSLFATAMPPGPAVQAIYTLKAKDIPAGITGIKIEALPDDRLPNNGPGVAPDGNFVLTEFTVLQQAAGQKKGEALKLRAHQADFEQKGFSIAASVNGNNDVADKGWALSPRTARRHEAIFETDPAATANATDGSSLTFVLQQGYQRQRYHLGRFRIYVSTSAQPLRFGTSQELAKIAKLSEDKRQPDQAARLQAEYLHTSDAYQATRQALAAARKPLPPDQQLIALEAKLAEARLPIQMDPQLLQLRRDMELSRQQMKNLRLTAAQDIAWALINSPAFLFNH